ncbi:MAG: hypothetical protein SAL07_07885, partial [Oscillatoria sp. PMC 1051.18]|nr:hypothetical protein [Oscillatoria sp. PMC 1051.18]
GNRNPLEFGNFTGQCAIQLKNVYFIHNNTVFYSATGTSHCAFLNPEPYAQHLRENSDYVELGNRNPLEFGNFTGQCAIQH